VLWVGGALLGTDRIDGTRTVSQLAHSGVTLRGHATNVWTYTEAAVEKQGRCDSIKNHADFAAIASTIEHWRAIDPVLPILARIVIP
jgi:hypothetical protein